MKRKFRKRIEFLKHQKFKNYYKNCYVIMLKLLKSTHAEINCFPELYINENYPHISY